MIKGGIDVRKQDSRSLEVAKMTDANRQWNWAKQSLDSIIENLGFPKELSDLVAKQLGSPKAIFRMVGYLENVRPTSEEIVVDEMLAISSEIDAWRDKKAAEEANMRYNEIIRYGLNGPMPR